MKKQIDNNGETMINSIDVNGKKFSYTPDRVEFLGELVNKFPNQESFGRKELKDAFDGYFPSWIKSSKYNFKETQDTGPLLYNLQAVITGYNGGYSDGSEVPVSVSNCFPK